MGNLKEKRRSRSMCLPACFSSSTHPFDVLDDEDYVRAPRSPMIPEIKDRCRNLMSRIGGGARQGRGRRRAASADFSYDASSYALNFEDETTRAENQLLLLGLPSRLPPSASGSLTPPEKSTTSRHILDDVVEEEEENRSWTQSPASKSRSRNIVSRIGRRGRNRHSSMSADFSYEPSSYALNFEDDSSRPDELSPVNGFMARLPHSPSPSSQSLTSPPPEKCSALRPEIVGFS